MARAASPLTHAQTAVLAAISAYIGEHGYAPSQREIQEACGYAAPSSVSYQLDELVRRGYLRRDPRRPRAIVLTEPTPEENQ